MMDETRKKELKEKLTAEQYQVACEHGTERPFTGQFWNSKEDGTYVCVACGTELFDSNTKFDSGTGWPSFYDVLNAKNVETTEDRTYGMRRVECHCANCKAHLGHVFEDGPNPTGLRYCINSASLEFEKR